MVSFGNGLESLQWFNINDLTLDPKNAKIHTEKQLNQLARIIETEGFNEPITIGTINNKDPIVICGNGRVKAMSILNEEKVPVVIKDFRTNEQRTSYGIKNNAIQQETGFDREQIQELLAEIETNNALEFENLKELDLQSIDLSFINAMNNSFSSENIDIDNNNEFKNTNQEINIDNIDTSECKIIFKFDALMYESVLNKINMMKKEKNIQTNELLLLDLLENA